MPNLNLTHRGNMNITSVNLTSAGTLDVRYEPNNTGAVTGFSFTPQIGSEFVCGDTYTITAIPKFSGNVLTETFTVSGADIAGVLRSDNSVLRQGYDSDLTHYELNLASVGATIISSSVTNAYLELEISIDSNEYAEIDIQPGSGDVIVYPIDNITGGDVPIVLATSVTIVVDSAITDSGFATSTYSPDNATVQMTYSSSNPDLATIDHNTGEITVLANGEVEFCVTDSVSNLSDCKTVTVEKSEEPGTTGITALTLSVAEDIVETGIAVPIYSSPDEEVSFVFTSSNPSLATIDSEGNITVLGNGEVTFCVRDEISGLEDCKTVLVRKAVYINDIEIVVADSIFETGVASALYTPTGATVDLYYSSSNPEIASIDPRTGEITAYWFGNVTFCVRDAYTNLSDCKTVRIVTPPRVCVSYNTDDVLTDSLGTFIFDGEGDWFSKAECDGRVLTPEEYQIPWAGRYKFPEGSSKTICYTLKDQGPSRYYWGIPSGCFTTPAYGSNVTAVVFEEADPFFNAQIFSSAFQSTPYLEELVIPKGWSLNQAGHQFENCTALKDIILSEDITEIPRTAFAGCTSLTSVTMTDNVVWLDAYAFAGCTSLSAITIPNNLQHIDNSFQNCTALQEVYIPNTLQWTGQDVFKGCTSLRDVYLQDYTVTIGISMFSGCNSLTGITVGSGVVNTFTDKFKYIGDGAFDYCFTGTTEMVFNIEEPSDDVSKIAGNRSFPIYIPCDGYLAYKTYFDDDSLINRFMPIGGEWCAPTAYTVEATYRITSTTEPVTVATNSSNIKRMYLEDGTTIPFTTGYTTQYIFPETGDVKVYYELFDKLFGVTLRKEVIDVVFPSQLEDSYVSLGGTSITGYTVQHSNYEYVMFQGSTALTSVQLTSFAGWTSHPPFGAQAFTFSGCTSLQSVEFSSEDNIYLARATFAGCTSLTGLSGNYSSMTIDGQCFEGCGMLQRLSSNENITVSFVKSQSAWASYHFNMCSSLTQNITITNDIKQYDFSGCTSLQSVILETGVTSIDWNAFARCSSLTSITAKRSTQPTIITSDSGSSFIGIASNGVLYYPSGSNYSGMLTEINKRSGGWTGSPTL